MTRITAARRFSLLATSSFVAANVLAGAGALTATAFMPSVALAACPADNAVLSGVEICDVNQTNKGLDYTVAKDGTVLDLVGVTITDNADDAITVDASGKNFATNFETNSGAGGAGVTLNATAGGASDGLEIFNAKDINVNTFEFDVFTNKDSDKASTISGFDSGLDLGGSGTIKVSISGLDTVTGLNNTAMFVSNTAAGVVDIKTAAGSTVTGVAGITVVSVGGTVGINAGGTVTATTNDALSSGGGGATTIASGTGAITAAGTGINLVGATSATITTGTGAVKGDSDSSGSGDGIQVSGVTGLAKITTGGTVSGARGVAVIANKSDINTTGGTVTSSAGVGVSSQNSGDGTIKIVTGNVNATGGDGVLASNSSATAQTTDVDTTAGTITQNSAFTGVNVIGVTPGDTTVKTGAVDASKAGTAGVFVSVFGKATVDTTGGAVKTLNGAGVRGSSSGNGFAVDVKTAAVTSTNGNGIFASATNGALTVNNTGAVSAGDQGIFTQNSGTGTTTVTVDGTIDAGIKLISAGVHVETSGTGLLKVVTNKQVNASFPAIWADGSLSGASIDIDVNGGALATNSDAVFAVTIGSANINIDIDSTVKGQAAGVTATAQDGVIDLDVTGALTGVQDEGANLIVTGGKIDVSVTGTGSSTGATYGLLMKADTALAAGDQITVDMDGSIGSVLGKVGVNGIDATINSGDGDVKITGDGSIFATGTGIAVTHKGTGNVKIDTNAAISSGLGGISANLNAATGDGNIDIKAGGPIAAGTLGGGGILAVQGANTTGAITIVTTATGDIAGGSLGSGISANTNATATSGDVKITADGDIGTPGKDVGGFGITASISTATNNANVSVKGSGNIFASNDGISAGAFGGNGNVVVNYDGGISSTTSNGINARTTGLGDVGVDYATNITVDTKMKADNIGILAALNNAANTNDVVINVGEVGGQKVEIDAKNIGIKAFTLGSGNLAVHLADNVTIDPDDIGIDEQPPVGTATVTTGANDTIIVDDGEDPTDDDATNVGILTTSNAAAGTGVTINLGANNTITVKDSSAVTGDLFADGGEAIEARILKAGSSAAIDITAANGLTINVSGDDGIGIEANTWSSSAKGNVSVSTGSGTLTITGGDAVASASTFGYSAGVISWTGGGNTKVDTGLDMTVTNASGGGTVGIYSYTDGTGGGLANGTSTVTLKTGGSIVSNNGAGIYGVTIDGNNTVNVNDDITAKVGTGVWAADGVDAYTFGQGTINVNVNTGGGSDILADRDGVHADNLDAAGLSFGDINVIAQAGTSIDGGNYGVWAFTQGQGDVFVSNAGTVTGKAQDGIHAEILGEGKASSDGFVTVTNTGSVTGAKFGIFAQNNTNDDVVVNNSGNVTSKLGGNDAISAGTTGVGGAVTVNMTGGVVTQNSGDDKAGIRAQITNNNNNDLVWVNITAGKIDAKGDGVFAQTQGAGNVKVDNAGTINGGLSGTAGDGVNAFAAGGGNVLVNNTGAISGDPGIKAKAIGLGTVTVFTSGTVSAVKDGINTSTVDGSNTVTVAGAGTVTSTTADGINATTSGFGLIDINTAATTTITTTGGGNGITANQTGTGDIDVDAFGAINAGSSGISATTTTGTVDILTGAGKIKGGAGDGIRGQSFGGGQVTITTGSGDVAGFGGAFGVVGFSAGGNVGINIGSGGSSEGGVVGQTTKTGTVIVNIGGDVNDSAFEGVRASSETGLSQVTLQANKSIKAGSTAGVLQQTTSGPIIFTGLAGSSITSNVGDGIHASSTLAGGTITITHAGTITTTGAGSDGVDAQTADATISITVDGAVNASAKGLSGVAGGANAVTITNNGAVKATGGEGLNLSSAGGNVTANANGSVEGTTAGIKTVTSGGGVTDINTTALVKATAGDGVNAFTSGGGPIDIDTGAVTGTVAGITAKSTGGSTITVDNAGAVAGGTGAGIHADTTGAGNITVTTGAAVSGAIGVDIATTGTGTLTVADNGFAITGSAGDGIKAAGGTGNVNIGTGPGQRVTGPISGADDGIDAKGAGNINVYVNGNITGDSDGDGAGDGVHAETSGVGAFSVIVDTTGGAIKAGDDGIEALGLGAGVTVTVTNTSTIDVANDKGIHARTSTGAVTVDNKGAISSQPFGKTASTGIWAESTTGTVKVDNTASIGATGPGNGVNSNGIVATNTGGGANTVTVKNSGAIFVDGPGLGTYGIYASTVGTGDVLVENTGVIDPPAVGIFGGGGGNVTINDSKNVTAVVEGIWGFSSGGAGKNLTVNITGGANILANGAIGDGVLLQAFNGANVTLNAKTSGTITGGQNGVNSTAQGTGITTIDTVAQVTGGTGDGIVAVVSGTGKIDITTGPVTGGDDGIDASATGAANINVTTAGAVLGGQNGISATTVGAGSVKIKTTGSTTGTAVDGIHAVTGGVGTVDVTTTGITFGGSDGIEATSGSGAVTVATTGATTGSTGDGIKAKTAGGASVTVNVGGVTAGGTNGVVAWAVGSGNVNVNDAGGFAITGGVFQGIDARSNTGNVNVGSSNANRITGNVSGADNGIVAFAGGAATVFTGADVTGDSDLNGAGLGIWAQTTNGGSVLIDTTGGTVKSTDYGILGQAVVAGGPITIVNRDAVQVRDNFGIAAQGTTGAVSVTNTGVIGTNAFSTGLNYGIYAESSTGQITIDNQGQLGNNAVGTSGLDTFGINANSYGANTVGITVTNSAAIWMDTGSDTGIKATNVGTGAVVVNNTGAIDPALYGVYAKGGGDVTVNNAANILAGTGIHADSTSVSAANTVSVFQRAPGTSIVGSAGNGIEASIAGPGTVNVGGPAAVDRIQGNVTGTGAGANGVFATGKGDVNVYTAGGTITGGSTGAAWGIKAQSTSVLADAVADEVVVNTQGLITGRQGILATNTGLTAGAATKGDTVQVTTTGAVTATDGNGIQAKSAAGDVTVSAGTNVTGVNLVAGGNAIGVDAESSAGGNVTVTTAGTIVGDLTGNAAGTGAAGIVAISAGGNGSVSVTANTIGSVSGGNYGIFASSVGTGSTTVNANVAVTGLGAGTVNAAAGPVGISATGGSGGVTVAVAAGQTVQAAAGRAIVTQSDGNAAITLGAGASARGLGDATHAVIDVTTTSAAGRNTITNAGLIQSLTATPGAYGDLAITGKTAAAATTGGTTINNNSGGTINGRLVFSGNQGTANVAFNNAAGAVWHTTGASALGVLGTGNDTITNAGQIFTNNAGSATSIDFGAGTGDSFTNTGALVAGEGQVAASASNLILTGLETFTNNGQISFGGSVGASDNAINDKINAGPAGTGALFGGTGKLFMDADLWSTAQATCASLTAADCLAVGTTTGTNSIVVNDINLHVVGAFNPNGIALVTGSTNAGANFRLDPASEFYNAAKFGGVLDKPGLFFYDLAWSAANGGTSLLIGVPDTEAFELNELGNAAQTIWYSSTGTWFDRQADLRQSLAGRSEGWAPSVWLKVVGDWAQRDNITSFSLLNKTYAFDVGFNQDTVGLIGGIDFLNVRENDEAYVFGGQVGYVDSDVRFNSPTRSNLSGMVVGLYGTYMNGGFFLDGIANANFLDLQHFTPTLPGPPAPGSANADVTSFGGQVEAGYQMAIGATGFWEPLASLAYVHTEIDTLSLGTSGSVDFPSTVSFRGSLGARVGMSGDFQYYKVRVALTGRLWDEFDGDNTLLIISPGPSNFSTHDDMGGTFGEVTLGGNLFTTGNNLSAFANIGVKFRSDYQDTNVSVGFRYQW